MITVRYTPPLASNINGKKWECVGKDNFQMNYEMEIKWLGHTLRWNCLIGTIIDREIKRKKQRKTKNYSYLLCKGRNLIWGNENRDTE